jgi:hypothetical protein
MDIPKVKKFDSKLYYQQNKEKINAYNRKYWSKYYQNYKYKCMENKPPPKPVPKPYTGCIIERNVTVTF